MKLRLLFFSHLKEVAGTAEFDWELAEGATVADLLEEIYGRWPAMRAWDDSILIGAGVEFVERAHPLQPGEEIAIMPPVQGG